MQMVLEELKIYHHNVDVKRGIMMMVSVITVNYVKYKGVEYAIKVDNV